MRYFFRVMYDGERFVGWQNQPNGVSVQELLEEALTVALRVPCAVVGAGRTDAGVHARAQGVHFDCDAEFDITKLTAALNAILPHDIAVYDMKNVAQDFHARFSATSRLYKYYITTRKNPLMYKRAWAIYHPVDWERVKIEAQSLCGAHDFTAFCSSGTDAKNMVCKIELADISLDNLDSGEIIFTIRADRFIYKMVRSLVGTLVDIGRGNLDCSMIDIIESKDRLRAGFTAPAHGLVLENVFY